MHSLAFFFVFLWLITSFFIFHFFSSHFTKFSQEDLHLEGSNQTLHSEDAVYHESNNGKGQF